MLFDDDHITQGDTTSRLYLRPAMDHRWVCQVARHQRNLIAAILAPGNRAPTPTPPRPRTVGVPQPTKLPTSIADLRRPPSLYFSSHYHGVTKHSRRLRDRPWEAYRDATGTKPRHKLGEFKTQEEAAWCVLKDRNPAATDTTGVTFSPETPPAFPGRARGACPEQELP